MTLDQLPGFVENFQHRVLQDALTEATSTYWRRRAATFRDARPRPGEFSGLASYDDLLDAWNRCEDAARACEAAAALALDTRDGLPCTCNQCGWCTPTTGKCGDA